MPTNIDTSTLANLGLTTKPKAKPTDKLGQEQFLKLMTTQIQNQDPFKPMENGDFLAQLAQFGTVSGIQDLQKSFSGLSTSLSSNQALQASSLIGRDIVIAANNFNHSSGKNLNGQVDLSNSASNVTVDVLDSSNQVVKTITLGQQPAGKVSFAWDGTNNKGQVMPAGNYKLQAKARIGGQDVAMQTLISQKVESVSLGKGQQGLQLNTSSKNTYAFSQVLQVK